MNRLQLRAPKALRRRPYRARRAPQHHDAVTAVLDATPAPCGLIVLAGVTGASVLVELIVALAVIA
jgi:hypothetical protein